MDKNQDKHSQDQSLSKGETSKVIGAIPSNGGFLFLFKKTERLVSALYLITGFFEDKEPLKWKLRNLGSELLSDSLILKDGAKGGKEKAITDMRDLILEIGSHLSVAKNARLMSEMNYSIIDEEFYNLMNLVTSDSHSILSRSFFNDGFYDNSKASLSTPTAAVQEVRAPFARTADVATQRESEVPNTDKGQSKTNLLDDESVREIKDKVNKKPKEVGTVSLKKNSRQNIILDIVKKRKEIMIKDVSPLISGCSEKTIQRELLAMVNAGILKKEGEKRWSRYSLVIE